MQTIESFFELIKHGGLMMVPLLISAFIGLTIIFERGYMLKKTFFLPENIKEKLRADLSASNRGDRQALVVQAKEIAKVHARSPVAQVVRIGLENVAAAPEDVERLMANEAQRWIPLLEKRLEILDTIITAAPLMGLLGTITGMMASFKVLSEKGVNEPNAITGGVAEALIATATGLVIALICLLAYNYFSAVVKEYITSMEEMANLLLEAKGGKRNEN